MRYGGTAMQNPSPLDLTQWAFYVLLPDLDERIIFDLLRKPSPNEICVWWLIVVECLWLPCEVNAMSSD